MVVSGGQQDKDHRGKPKGCLGRPFMAVFQKIGELARNERDRVTQEAFAFLIGTMSINRNTPL